MLDRRYRSSRCYAGTCSSGLKIWCYTESLTTYIELLVAMLIPADLLSKAWYYAEVMQGSCCVQRRRRPTSALSALL